MAGIVNKIKNTISHDNAESTPSYTSAGDRSTTATGTTPSHTAAGDRTGLAETNAERTVTGSDAAKVGATSTPASATTQNTATGLEGKAERGVEHVREHAQPPAHHHNQPRNDALVSETEAKQATHDHQHLAPVTHETRHHHEVEEVERQREIDRHVHHIQHHTQPVLDEQHAAEQHHQKIIPQTEIHENHVATEEDKANFAALNTAHDSVAEGARDKTIIDRGEQVLERKIDHVHHVVQPVIERDVHEHERQHTTVPIHQTTHEAPIVHQSTQHAPLRMDEFVQGGGDLNSTLKHDANLLDVAGKDCTRTVDGPAETLVSNLGLQPGATTGATTATTGASATPTSAAGTTGGSL
ncbi:hypothetical protein JCM10213_007497 [Rhodosporidiobolus nylandii]